MGSNEPIQISDLALKIKEIVNPQIDVSFRKNDVKVTPSRYVPDISKICENLKVENKCFTADAVSRTASWWQNSNKRPRQ